MHALGLWLLACAAAVAAWPARRLGTPARAAVLLPLAAVGFVVPFFGPPSPVWVRGAMVLQCPLLGFRLLDLHVGAADWRTRSFGEWLAYLANPVVIVYRLYKRQRLKPVAESARLVMRGAIEIAAGTLVLSWAFGREWPAGSFWPEHVAKLAGIYLCVLDGGFVFLTGAARLLGFPVADGSRNPIAAVTPADFWRRYNMEAGRLLHADVALPLAGMHRPLAGMLAAFLINGVFHEYLASLMIGRVIGYQVALFSICGVASAATWRWRPRGAMAVLSWAGTVVFMVMASVLFFSSADQFMEWYSTDNPIERIWPAE